MIEWDDSGGCDVTGDDPRVSGGGPLREPGDTMPARARTTDRPTRSSRRSTPSRCRSPIPPGWRTRPYLRQFMKRRSELRYAGRN